MTGYFHSMNEFCTDPVDGTRRPIDHIMLGTVIVFSPILAPLYHLGVLGVLVGEELEHE